MKPPTNLPSTESKILTTVCYGSGYILGELVLFKDVFKSRNN